MIKLTVSSESGSVSYTFEKKFLTIGEGSSPEIDLSIQGLLSLQIKIVNEEGVFIISNCSNDPYLTLNNFPFGKKILQNKDVLHVNKNVISFEIIESADQSHVAPSTETTKNSSPLPFDIEKELNSLEQQVDEALLGEALNIESLMEEVKSFDYAEEDHQNPSTKSPKTEVVVKEKTQPDSQENLKKVVEKRHSPQKTFPGKKGKWRFFLALSLTSILFLASFSAWAYIHLSEKAVKQEMLAAQSVSDIAMALTYSQINHIQPQMQNWSDPKFLKEHFSCIIPENSSFLAQVDSHSHLINCPYILRIYTNKNSSRFLISALPAPSIFQWLIPKHAILVDSQAMELRKIHDLRDLNRLLIHPNTLENQNGMEISALIKQGTLLPLHMLATKTGNSSFAPPLQLATLHPGAENYIYNAPRYHPFGEAFAKRAVNLINATENSSQELRNLQEEMTELSKLPHLIIYSTNGEAFAAQSKKAFKTFVPQSKFLTAYLQKDTAREFSETRLLLEDELFSPEPQSTVIKHHSLHPDISSFFVKSADDTHPLKYQLIALASNRKQALEPVVDEMVKLLNNHTAAHDSHFEDDFTFLLKKYIEIEHQEIQKIVSEIHSLYETYSHLPLTEVLPYIKAAGLEQIALSNPKIQNANFLTNEQFDNLLLSIQSAQGFTELAEAVANTTSYVCFKHIPDPDRLMIYQKRVRVEVIKKLDTFLLSPHFPLSPQELTPEKRKLLAKILEQSWITDNEEQQYYMSEFDELTKLLH